jgi:uncharacterized membrane protein
VEPPIEANARGGPQSHTIKGQPSSSSAKEASCIARCDVDCTDIDLRLKAPGGREIEKDVDDDDIPEVSVTPGEEGEYTVRVTMANCNRKPCFFAVGALIRDEAARR